MSLNLPHFLHSLTQPPSIPYNPAAIPLFLSFPTPHSISDPPSLLVPLGIHHPPTPSRHRPPSPINRIQTPSPFSPSPKPNPRPPLFTHPSLSVVCYHEVAGGEVRRATGRSKERRRRRILEGGAPTGAEDTPRRAELRTIEGALVELGRRGLCNVLILTDATNARDALLLNRGNIGELCSIIMACMHAWEQLVGVEVKWVSRVANSAAHWMAQEARLSGDERYGECVFPQSLTALVCEDLKVMMS